MSLEPHAVGNVDVVAHGDNPGLGAPNDASVHVKILPSVDAYASGVFLRRVRMHPPPVPECFE